MFLISYAPPHKPVSSRTLTRWVSDILHKAGIHTKTFKSHSLRSASTSNAFSGGLSLNEIILRIGVCMIYVVSYVVKPLNSGHPPVLKTLSVIEKCSP